MKPPESMAMRDACAQALIEAFPAFPNLIVLDADVSKSTRSAVFGKVHPERFLNVGIAEQNMLGIAAGLASAGMLPVVNSFSSLLSLRALDQIRQSVVYPRLNVKIMAHYGGLSAGPEGSSHHAVEDLGIIRSIPNITVLVPCDAGETRSAVRAALEHDGPVYLRMCRNPLPPVYGEPPAFRIGRGNLLREGTDVTIVAIGVMVARALDAADVLAASGVSARVIAMPSLKPLDRDLIEAAAHQTGALVTAEEHSIIGGLGSAVAETLVECAPVPMVRVGISDRFAESGEYFQLMDKYGLGVSDIVQAAHRVLAHKPASRVPAG